MSTIANAPIVVRAKILRDVTDQPIQLVMSATLAADLAFIAEDFARNVVQDSDEASRLVRVADMVSARLRDCLAALGEGR